MADDIITPQIRNGGTGSNAPSSSGVDYRQLQAPEAVRTDLPDNGAAAKAAELRRAFQEFEGVSHSVYEQTASHAGALAGAASGDTGHPQYKQGLARLTAYGRAFNNAATGAYAVQAEAQADDSAASARVSANKDPDVFAANYAARRDAVLKEAPAEARPMLAELYNRRLAQVQASMRGDQLEEQRLLHKQQYDLGVERDTSRVATLQGSADPHDQLEAADQMTLLAAKIHGGVVAGLYSAAEGDAKLLNAHKEITKQVFETQVDRELANMSKTGDSTGIVALLERFRQMHLDNSNNPNEPQVLSEDEFNQLMSNAKQKVMQEKQIDYYTKNSETAAQKAKFDAGDRDITIALAQGTSGPVLQQRVAAMMASEDLRPEVGRAILDRIQRGQDAPVDHLRYFRASQNPDRFNWSSDQILQQVGGNAKEAVELAKTIEAQRQGWEGHAAIKDARQGINSDLKLPSGPDLEMASPEQKLAAQHAQTEFTERMNAIPVDQRDAQAPRVRKNVVLEMQAVNLDADAQRFLRSKKYIEDTYGAKGNSPDAEKYKQGMAQADAAAQAARDKAAALRKQETN